MNFRSFRNCEFPHACLDRQLDRVLRSSWTDGWCQGLSAEFGKQDAGWRGRGSDPRAGGLASTGDCVVLGFSFILCELVTTTASRRRAGAGAATVWTAGVGGSLAEGSESGVWGGGGDNALYRRDRSWECRRGPHWQDAGCSGKADKLLTIYILSLFCPSLAFPFYLS